MMNRTGQAYVCRVAFAIHGGFFVNPAPAPSLDALWNEAPLPPEEGYDPASIPGLPEPVRRYLNHALASGSPLAAAVRLEMHGEIRLRRWFPFRAEQVIAPAHGMRWQARVGRFPLWFCGYDVVHEGRGGMRWKLFGLKTVMAASGPDIDKASIARLQAELVWLPSGLLPGPRVRWALDARGRPEATVDHFDVATRLRLDLAENGRVQGLDLERWGGADGAMPALRPYGAIAEAERTFAGHTIPTRLRVAWAHASDAAFAETEYFRCEIAHAAYRT